MGRGSEVVSGALCVTLTQGSDMCDLNSGK